MKKAWESPKLIVLVRVRPQESVLSNCKDCGMVVPNGPGYAFDGCEYAIPEICPICEMYVTS